MPCCCELHVWTRSEQTESVLRVVRFTPVLLEYGQIAVEPNTPTDLTLTPSRCCLLLPSCQGFSLLFAMHSVRFVYFPSRLCPERLRDRNNNHTRREGCASEQYEE